MLQAPACSFSTLELDRMLTHRCFLCVSKTLMLLCRCRTSQKPPHGNVLYLNGTGSGLVNNACFPSSVAPSYAPSGQVSRTCTLTAPACQARCLFAAGKGLQGLTVAHVRVNQSDVCTATMVDQQVFFCMLLGTGVTYSTACMSHHD